VKVKENIKCLLEKILLAFFKLLHTFDLVLAYL